MSLGIPPRFAIRQVGATWTVYNWRDLEPARVGGVVQISLGRDVAAAIAERLNVEALRDRGPRSDQRFFLAKSRELKLVTAVEAA